MNTRIFLLLSVVSALLQGSLLPPVFLEGLLVLLFVLPRDSRRVFLALFVVGLIFDLVQNQHLGLTSLIFLSIVLVTHFTRGALTTHNPFYLATLALVINFIRSKLVFGEFFLTSNILSWFLCSLLLFFVLQILDFSANTQKIRVR